MFTTEAGHVRSPHFLPRHSKLTGPLPFRVEYSGRHSERPLIFCTLLIRNRMHFILLYLSIPNPTFECNCLIVLPPLSPCLLLRLTAFQLHRGHPQQLCQVQPMPLVGGLTRAHSFHCLGVSKLLLKHIHRSLKRMGTGTQLYSASGMRTYSMNGLKGHRILALECFLIWKALPTAL